MSKCIEAFEEHFAGFDLTREQLGNEPAPFYFYTDTQERWEDWQACWNARGKVDAEICEEKANEFNKLYSREADGAVCCKNAIEKENEQ